MSMLLSIFDIEYLKARNATKGNNVIELEQMALTGRAFWRPIDNQSIFDLKPNMNFDLKEDENGQSNSNILNGKPMEN